MGLYVNIGNDGFRAARNGEYVDKSMLIAEVNALLYSERQFICVSRARRFGKSMAAKMLNAYYDQSCDSRALFEDLRIAHDPSFEKHLNKYPVLYVDMTNFVTRYRNGGLVEHIESDVIAELREAYPEIRDMETDNLLKVLSTIVARPNQEKFIMIIDEWDAVLRENPSNEALTNAYIDLLRRLFKSGNAQSIFACAYITGILPIKKYNTQSALNNFEEYTMINPEQMAPYFGFTEQEVRGLCERYGMEQEQMRMWYDGYEMGVEKSVYNPLSVIRAISRKSYASYWTKTGTYETVSAYINMNFEGLKDDIIRLLTGSGCAVETSDFQNDLHDIRSKNDVLTVLLHLGYLSYDHARGECRIPNREIALEFEKAIEESTEWEAWASLMRQSSQLLQWTIDGDARKVAEAIERIHTDSTSILRYNDENSMACVLMFAYYAAKGDYAIVREMPTGKGFADLVLVPKREVDRPAIVVELKYDKTVRAAIGQIKEKGYADALRDYVGEVVLVGINYNKRTKKHECEIEKWVDGKIVPSKDAEVVPSKDVEVVPSSGEKNVPSRDGLMVLVDELFAEESTIQKRKIAKVLVQLAIGELSTSEMMALVGEKNRSRLRKRIIKPLLDKGVIVMCLEDNPNDPNQRYKMVYKW